MSYVNLNEVGGLTRSGRGYDATADDNVAESRAFAGRMDGARQGLRGAAGGVFTGVAEQHSANLAQLGHQIAQQALRAVRGERAILTADDESASAQQAAASAVEGVAQALNRPITF